MAHSSASSPKTERTLIALLVCALSTAPAHAQDACASDADCDDDLACTRVLFGTDCQSGECLEVLEQGFCAEPEPEPLRCDDQGECPSPLYCDTEHPEGALCAYVEPSCSNSDSECPTGFMCVDLEPLGGCELCEDTENGPECKEAPCEENGLNVCSPIAMTCEADGDCAAGFVCREVGAFDLQLGWQESWVGMRACLSVGLIAVQDGVVQGGVDGVPAEPGGDGDGGVAGGGAGGASGDGASAGAGGGAVSGGPAGSGAGASGGPDDAADSDESSGGCSCSVHGRSSPRAVSFGLVLALLLGALALRRWPVG